MQKRDHADFQHRLRGEALQLPREWPEAKRTEILQISNAGSVEIGLTRLMQTFTSKNTDGDSAILQSIARFASTLVKHVPATHEKICKSPI